MTDIQTVSNESIINLRNSLNANVSKRIADETAKNAHSAALKVSKYTRFDFKTSACNISDAVLQCALDVKLTSFDCFNDHKRDNQAFNIYAIEKLMKAVLATASTAFKLDQYTLVVLQNLKHKREQIEAKSFAMTRDHCYVAASADMTRENVKKTDVKYRLSSRDASTVSTQISSSLRVLEALNVVRVVNSVLTSVNFDHALFKHVA